MIIFSINLCENAFFAVKCVKSLYFRAFLEVNVSSYVSNTDVESLYGELELNNIPAV